MRNLEINFKIRKIKNKKGFGLSENILSAALLIFLVTFSMYFISMRHKIMFNANLNDAINDEIKRDIEILKSELLNNKVSTNENDDYSIIENNTENCEEDILFTINNLNSWNPDEWNPGSDKLTREGQIKNKIFKGSKVKIKRIPKIDNPLLANIDESEIDDSIVNIQYLVKLDKNKENWKIWSNVVLSNELKSYCPPL
tara:strand:- start:2483 stop:3079 length:597 start_codon:yes stop_codon:yes gene_type:complete